MSSLSIRIKCNNNGATSFQRRHDIREGRQPDYVDASRSHLNSVLIEPLMPGELLRLCKTRAALIPRKRALKSDAATSVMGILTFSTEAQRTIDALTVDDQNRRILESCKAAAGHIGVELTGLVVHRDESALHAHFQMPSRRPDGRPVSKTTDCRKLQDVAAAAWEDLGVTRGKAKLQRIKDGDPLSTIVNRSVKQLHEDLPRELDAARAALQKTVNLHKKAQASLKAAEADSETAKKLRRRIRSYEARLETKRAEIAATEAAMASITDKGSKVGAFIGGLRDAVKDTDRQLDQWKSRAIKAEKSAAAAAKEAAAAVAEGRKAKGQASVIKSALDKKKVELDQYKQASAGMPPAVVAKAVKEYIARRGATRDPSLEPGPAHGSA